jgi:hypothetical protein
MRSRDTKPEARRLATAFDLFELGRSMQREQLRRSFPAASESELAQRLQHASEQAAERADLPSPFVRSHRIG